MCGVVGVVSRNYRDDIGQILCDGLVALQHRGQESAGIAWSSKEHLYVYKDVGMVHEIFNENLVRQIKSNIGMGHVRYSTIKAKPWESSQPIIHRAYDLAMSHNGQIDSSELLKSIDTGEKYIAKDKAGKRVSDSSVLFNAISLAYDGDKFDIKHLVSIFNKVKGAYSLLIMNKSSMYCIRDPYGYHPLSIGLLKDKDGIIVSSENSTIDTAGGNNVRDIKPGEIVCIDSSAQIETVGYIDNQYKSLRRCAFEHIYISRCDSTSDGVSSYRVRKKLGALLGEKFQRLGYEVDMVMPVPDSSIPYALGFYEKTKIPYSQPIIRNNYVGRSFIKPSNVSRLRTLHSKFNIVGYLIENKRIVVVDDSIVRGNTQKVLVELLKQYSPKEIHICVGSPSIRYECYYGVDIASKDELIANKFSVEIIREKLGVNSLTYLTLGELQSALGSKSENEFCFSCINGKYM